MKHGGTSRFQGGCHWAGLHRHDDYKYCTVSSLCEIVIKSVETDEVY